MKVRRKTSGRVFELDEHPAKYVNDEAAIMLARLNVGTLVATELTRMRGMVMLQGGTACNALMFCPLDPRSQEPAGFFGHRVSALFIGIMVSCPEEAERMGLDHTTRIELVVAHGDDACVVVEEMHKEFPDRANDDVSVMMRDAGHLHGLAVTLRPDEDRR
jgi:hypothetical protein